MKNLKNIPYKTIAVLGLARSGLAAIQALKDNGISICAWDDNDASRAAAEGKGYKILSLEGGLLKDVDAVLISPGIPHTLPQPHPVASKAKELGIPLITDISLYKDLRSPEKNTLFAITGTNGKSTTTTLLTHVLNGFCKAEAGGNIGKAVFSLSDDIDCAVLELSSYQTELTDDLNADGVIWLNITPDHIDRHGDIKGYVDAKKKIFERVTIGGKAIIACDDDPSKAVANEVENNINWDVTRVSTSEILRIGISVVNGNLYEDGEFIGSLLTAENLKGVHNHQNAACVYALTRKYFDSDPQSVLQRIISFDGLAHRQKKITELNGVTFINDSKATNADATSKALSSFQNIYWLAGGVPKEGGIESLPSLFLHVKKAYFYGEAKAAFQETAQENNLASVVCNDLSEAVQRAYKDAILEEDSIVLLSPACASFDQYKSFEERGAHFIDLVNKLEK